MEGALCFIFYNISAFYESTYLKRHGLKVPLGYNLLEKCNSSFGIIKNIYFRDKKGSNPNGFKFEIKPDLIS